METSGYEPKLIAAGYSTKLGDYVDVDFVDKICKEELSLKRKNVANSVSKCSPPLNAQQIDSLVAITYQYGNIGNFVSVYNQYGNTDQLKQNLVVNGYNPYIQGPESNGRAQANWKLFHEGKYTNSEGKEIVVSSSSGNSEIAEKIIEAAKSKLGCKYVYGATGPSTFDCSGLTQWCYAKAGITIGRTDANQKNGAKKVVDVKDARPGDILWTSGHVGICTKNDNGKIEYIHAPQTGDVVKYSTYNQFTKALRYY